MSELADTRTWSRLDALGFMWDPLTDQWEEGIARLKAFVKEHGHCRVSNDYATPDGYRLGLWVVVQRRQRDGMPAERKSRLDALAFIWDPLTDQWEEGFEHLQAFMKKHGHCRVPQRYVTTDGYRLGSWVSVRRQEQGQLPAERRSRLDALGFIWDPLASKWEKGFQHLQAFMKEHQHCRVPKRYVTSDGYRLGSWVSEQRKDQERMSAERKARLDALGFVWSALKKDTSLSEPVAVE